jgi:hypothetical protein
VFRNDPEQSKAGMARRDWNARIHRAFQDQRFTLYFQAVHRASDLAVSHHEALVRLVDEDDPTRLLSPEHFVPHAERSGKIRQLDRWVIESCISRLAGTAPKVRIAANLSARSLEDPGFPGYLRDALQYRDVDPRRLGLIEETLRRLQRRATCRVGDLSRPGALQGAGTFERVLVDAPCSSTGVIRRHPDIKLLRRASDIEALARTQQAILREAFDRLAPGGRLVYATCSLLPRENEAQVLALLGARPEAQLLPWPESVPMPPGARRLESGVQLLPGAEADTDGFYYACLGRRPS